MANRIEIPFVVDTLIEIEGKQVATPVVGATVVIKSRAGGGAVVVSAVENAETPIVPTTDKEGRIRGWVEEGAYELTVSGGTPAIASVKMSWDALSGRGIEHPRVGVESVWRSDLASPADT